MKRLVKIFAPVGPVDYCFKAVVLLLFLGAMNWARDHIEHKEAAEGFWNNFLEATFVGLLPALLALALVGHLNRLQITLEKAALTDPLTNLPNRRSYFDQVRAALPEPGGILMMLDADNFKKVNDTHGHGVGDRCLVQIADLLRANLRAHDVVARLGGEEFGVLLVDAQQQEAHAIGTRLIEGVSLDLDGPATSHKVTLSIGAISTAGSADIADLLRRADAALYAAKSAGRARIVFADPVNPQELPTTVSAKEVA